MPRSGACRRPWKGMKRPKVNSFTHLPGYNSLINKGPVSRFSGLYKTGSLHHMPGLFKYHTVCSVFEQGCSNFAHSTGSIDSIESKSMLSPESGQSVSPVGKLNLSTHTQKMKNPGDNDSDGGSVKGLTGGGIHKGRS